MGRVSPVVVAAAVLVGAATITACSSSGSETVACVPVSAAVAAQLGATFGATVADPAQDGGPRWFYGKPDDVLFISNIDPEGDGAGEVRPLTGNAATYSTEQRDAPDSDFPDDGPASLSFASNEGNAPAGRSIQCATSS